MSGKRLSLFAIRVVTVILACHEFGVTAQLQIPRPNTVFVPVPFDRLLDVRWSSSNTDYMESTCGTFKAYKNTKIENANRRWYVAYMSDVPTTTTDYCSQFTKPCGCLGIDFTTALEHGAVQFVMFSTNTYEKSTTYEIATAWMIGRNQLNFDQIILQSFVLQPNAKIVGKGGYIIPQSVVVDSDDFSSYMTLLFCLEGATQPVVMILSDALPMFDQTENEAFEYLKRNGLDANLFAVNHNNCKYAQKIVRF